MISRKKDDSNYDDLKNFSSKPIDNKKTSKRGFSLPSVSNKFFFKVREIFSNKEIVSRIVFTLSMIVIYRMLASIPLPGINMTVFDQFLNTGSASEANLLFATFTGGQLESPSIVGLGIAAYINASIIMQLLTPTIPKLSELSKEGERGKKLISQYTRFLTLPLAILYSIAYVILMARRDLNVDAAGNSTGEPAFLVDPAMGSDWPSLSKIIFMTIILTAGSMFVMWLSELITEKGIGNGSSIMITIGILAALPSFIINDFRFVDFNNFLSNLLTGNFAAVFGSRVFLMLSVLLGAIIVVAMIVFVSESQRKIKIQYARRLTEGGDANLPIKLTITGVLPLIFAAALLAVPQLAVPLLQNFAEEGTALARVAETLNNSFLLSQIDSAVNMNDLYYGIAYFILIVAFGVFYAYIVIKPEDTAENLQKSGAFIPGIRPGKETQRYISYVLARIGFAGGIFLGLIALVPLLARLFIVNQTDINLLVLSGIGGTSILIVVSVVINTVRQFNSYRVSRSYNQFVQ